MGKIYGENLWGKFMGKIYGENQWYFSTLQTYWKIVPLAAIKDMGIKDMEIFNGTLSHNGNGKKYVNLWGKLMAKINGTFQH